MKRSQRFMCSTASQSIAANTRTRTRKRSRTSSARGDGLTGAAEPKIFREASSRRSKTMSNVRPRSGSPRNSRKVAETSRRVSRPNFGSLQSAIVLAPFNALKSRFQDKLVDLYSREKMKKIGRRGKMARQQSASFQYDIIELKPLGTALKKEAMPSKKTKKSRSPSYCQCKTRGAKEGQRPVRKSSRRKRKKASDNCLPISVPRYSRAPDMGRMAGTSPDRGPPQPSRDVAPVLDFYLAEQPLTFSDAGLRSSAVSSRGTRSNSSSCREGRVEGSFAISSTSFASYLKHFVQNRDRSERGRRYGGRTKARKGAKKSKEKFLPKPKAAESSRHLIVRLEKKNTDEHIVHFLDREPRSREIPFETSSHHLQPLRRQGREKEKKVESERSSTYYLRSHSSGKKNLSEGRREAEQVQREERGLRRGNESGVKKVSQMEVATQVGRGVSERGDSAGGARPGSRQEGPTAEVGIDDVCGGRATVEPPPGTNSPPSPADPTGDSELPDELLLPQRMGPLESRSDFEGSRAEEPNPGFPGERSDSDSTEMAERPGHLFQEFPGSQEPQDKESDFIFGPRNAESRLGGSCEFSFGLNSVFPEDED